MQRLQKAIASYILSQPWLSTIQAHGTPSGDRIGTPPATDQIDKSFLHFSLMVCTDVPFPILLFAFLNLYRLQETLIPVMSESVQSMLKAGYTVDVFLVCHFILRPDRFQLVRDALPASVGLDYWNSATPLGYDTGKEPFKRLQNRTLHLARQHRFVIKDKLAHYDMFVCFEDDMVIHADHIQHYSAITNELSRLRETAPDTVHLPHGSRAGEHYHGPVREKSLSRCLRPHP